MFMNIAGAIFAVTAVVLYAIDLSNASILWMCERSRNKADRRGDNCRNLALFAQVGMRLKLNWKPELYSSGKSIQCCYCSKSINTIVLIPLSFYK